MFPLKNIEIFDKLSDRQLQQPADKAVPPYGHQDRRSRGSIWSKKYTRHVNYSENETINSAYDANVCQQLIH